MKRRRRNRKDTVKENTGGGGEIDRLLDRIQVMTALDELEPEERE